MITLEFSMNEKKPHMKTVLLIESNEDENNLLDQYQYHIEKKDFSEDLFGEEAQNLKDTSKVIIATNYFISRKCKVTIKTMGCKLPTKLANALLYYIIKKFKYIDKEVKIR